MGYGQMCSAVSLGLERQERGGDVVGNCAKGLRCSYSRVLGFLERVSDPRDLIGPEEQGIRGYLSK
ncbi:hypothetical protein MKY54_05820 [Paenibacillus sp. FSL P2-0121]|uniref:hypothetical protein n=1 Tax=Paenibacillus sp. FSL P2-0121 TaxID=2921626 RepID=UPI0030CEE95E